MRCSMTLVLVLLFAATAPLAWGQDDSGEGEEMQAPDESGAVYDEPVDAPDESGAVYDEPVDAPDESGAVDDESVDAPVGSGAGDNEPVDAPVEFGAADAEPVVNPFESEVPNTPEHWRIACVKKGPGRGCAADAAEWENCFHSLGIVEGDAYRGLAPGKACAACINHHFTALKRHDPLYAVDVALCVEHEHCEKSVQLSECIGGPNPNRDCCKLPKRLIEAR